MAFDEELAARTRAALGEVQGVTEIKMFGGLCFTVHRNMAVGVTGNELMVRLAPKRVTRHSHCQGCGRWTSPANR